jgi:hypothetical protein
VHIPGRASLAWSEVSEDDWWCETPLSLCCVDFALLCAHYYNGYLFVWLWAWLDYEEAERLECRY